MKKVLALILAAVMTLCLFGCNNNTDNPETKPSTFEEEIENNTPVETKPVENGELPEDKENLNLQESEYLRVIITKALLTLDLDTLKEYITEDNYKILEEIASDSTKKDIYLKTIGTAQLLEDSNFLLVRSGSYVFTKWYSDMKAAGTLPVKLDDLSATDIENIYTNYYLTAPYQLILLTETEENIADGTATFDMTEAFYGIGIFDIAALNTDNMLIYMFGQNAYENYSTNTIESLVDLSKYFESGFDMNKVYEYIQTKYPKYNSEDEPINWLVEIAPQFEDEKTRNNINKWAEKKLSVYAGNCEITVFMPLTFDNIMSDDEVVTTTFYGQYMARLTSADMEALKSYEVVHPLVMDGSDISFFESINTMIKVLLATEVIK